MQKKSEIDLILKMHKKRLCSNYPIRSLAIFGSYARNEQHEDSDLDLLVDFSDKIGIRFIDLAEELEEILKIKVDLVSINGINEKYLDYIKKDIIYV
jgi:predicted nucleotidyltransferase